MALSTTKEYGPNEIITAAGQPENRLFFVSEGVVEAFHFY